jgi:hypothetical protein
VFEYFDPFPKSAKNAVILLVAAWAIFLLSLFKLYPPEVHEGYERHMIAIAVLMCFFIIRGYNWGRWLCTLGNVMLIIYLSFFAILLKSNTAVFVATIVVILLFAASIFFLWTPETTRFFKTFRNPDAGKPNP